MISIETDRLLLRPFQESDLDAYAAMMADPEVMRFMDGPQDRTTAWRGMAGYLGHWVLRGYGLWAVEQRASGELIGRIGLINVEGWPGLEVGWTFDPAHWGRGYATEAGQASVEWAFANHAVDELVSVILPDNAASQGVARRLGFRLREERVLSFFPAAAHGIWVLPRPA